ncbi:MAG: hypothetical protein KR126chlam3_01452 [Chlamydiae bacterium]|nr:hypothetical protein [Chlamydiota bacterium]
MEVLKQRPGNFFSRKRHNTYLLFQIIGMLHRNMVVFADDQMIGNRNSHNFSALKQLKRKRDIRFGGGWIP